MKHLSLGILLLSSIQIHASEQQSKLAAVFSKIGISRVSVFSRDGKGPYKGTKTLDEDFFDDDDEEEELGETATKSKPCKMFKDEKNSEGKEVYTEEYAEKIRNYEWTSYPSKRVVHEKRTVFYLIGPVDKSMNIVGPAKECAVEPIAIFGLPREDGYMRQIAAIHTFRITEQYGEGHVRFGKSRLLNSRYKFEVAEPTGK